MGLKSIEIRFFTLSNHEQHDHGHLLVFAQDHCDNNSIAHDLTLASEEL